MPLINCDVELKLKWAKYCVLSAADNENENDNANILFLLSKTQIYMFLL